MLDPTDLDDEAGGPKHHQAQSRRDLLLPGIAGIIQQHRLNDSEAESLKAKIFALCDDASVSLAELKSAYKHQCRYYEQKQAAPLWAYGFSIPLDDAERCKPLAVAEQCKKLVDALAQALPADVHWINKPQMGASTDVATGNIFVTLTALWC